MNAVTLALAKAHTDRRVDKRNQVNLYDWGIDLYTILAEMIANQKTCVAKQVNAGYEFWTEIANAGDNVVFNIGGEFANTAFAPSVLDTSADTSMKAFVGFNIGVLVSSMYVKGTVYLYRNGAFDSVLIMEATSLIPEF